MSDTAINCSLLGLHNNPYGFNAENLKTELNNVINNIKPGEAILTTEKDGVKLKYFKRLFFKHNIPVYVLPIKMKILFDEEKEFKDLVSEKINN